MHTYMHALDEDFTYPLVCDVCGNLIEEDTFLTDEELFRMFNYKEGDNFLIFDDYESGLCCVNSAYTYDDEGDIFNYTYIYHDIDEGSNTCNKCGKVLIPKKTTKIISRSNLGYFTDKIKKYIDNKLETFLTDRLNPIINECKLYSENHTLNLDDWTTDKDGTYSYRIRLNTILTDFNNYKVDVSLVRPIEVFRNFYVTDVYIFYIDIRTDKAPVTDMDVIVYHQKINPIK